MEVYKGANRYGLVLETVNGKKYYYNMEKHGFIEFEDEEKITKTSLNRLDFMTSSYNNIHDFAKVNGINDDIRIGYLVYNHVGRKHLQLCFNNPTWCHVAYTYRGDKIDFKDKKNLEAFNAVYKELINPNSQFANIIINNAHKTINIFGETIETIKGLVRYEKDLRQKFLTDSPNKSMYTALKVRETYDFDKTGFYYDLKSKLTKYRDFRTVYLNYCKYINKVNQKLESAKKDKQKTLVREEQLKLF